MITAKAVGKTTELIGIVDKIGKPYMRITNARFECPSCGSIISVIQEGKRFREPTRCSCGRRGGFVTISTETVEGQDIYVLEQLSDFGYIVYLEKPELIRKLTRIQEGCGVKVTGIPRVEYKQGSAVGDIVLDAKTLERNKRKVAEDDWDATPLKDNVITKGMPAGSVEKTEHGCGTGLDGFHYCGDNCSGHVYLCDKCEKKLDVYLEDAGIINSDTDMTTKETPEDWDNPNIRNDIIRKEGAK